MTGERDEAYLALALDEARAAAGRTSPNPPVGAVIVKGRRVVAAGHTAPAGGPHAEVVALRAAGRAARGATLYTTLEPCVHHGRTPPCTEAILAAGISRVVVGARDRNPLVAGKGLARLRSAGLQVEVADLDGACEAVNAPFFTWVEQHRPYVILKAAATLDGRIATRTGDSRWITGKAARALGHQWRDRVDAILVGAGTVRADDPRLTTRLPGVEGRDPVRVVLDGRLTTDPRAKIYGQRSKAPTWLAVPARTGDAKVAPYARRPRTEVLRVPGARGRVDLPALLAELARREIMTLLVEGGGEVHGALLAAGLVDEVRLFLAPTLLGEGPAWLSLPEGTGPARLADAWKLGPAHVARVGDDVLLTARVAR
jgi:diaminohydroxyphosphoribosylaminopyrimidine deaminase/5-amino-6-(5-phosphoribosylamino)uracil reductase